MDQWITQLVSTVGIPGAICFYVLAQLKKSVDANTKAITLLAAKFNINVDQPDQQPAQVAKNPFAEVSKQ